ncbi:MAG TPA: class I SAM-dependent methyltransferase [Planctomycetes bacterium]|nr:class I SAM-dependent methyltransferase [Planctomycetota bacterium]
MLARVLETEAMDTLAEATDYDAMDHSEVNRAFVDDLLAAGPGLDWILDLGAGTAQIPILLCQREQVARVLAADMAQHMLIVAGRNIARAGLGGRIRLHRVDAKRLPYRDGSFGAVVSNSIVHHIPQPATVLEEAWRVTAPGGLLFFRDLCRPQDEDELSRLVRMYAEGANEHQRKMFADSLRASLSVDEMRRLVEQLGGNGDAVRMTSDRHWTWSQTREDRPCRAVRG